MFASLSFEGDTRPADVKPERLWATKESLCVGIILFDVLIGNPDRHTGNIKVDNPAKPTRVYPSLAYLEHLAAIRHRIAHDQKDARTNFDTASSAIAGRTYPGARPGKFLRDTDRSSPPRRWLEVTTDDLVNLARQMV